MPVPQQTDKYFCAGILPAIFMFSEQARCLFHNRKIFVWSWQVACYSYVFRTGKMPVPQQKNIFVEQVCCLL
ncbi:hypothetical protein QUA08_06500 [Microcoleus sp. T3B2]|uniref:hypothetical protein n=1 Tax=Microcoleus sp. T3B2 TaxID=3055426 RepID=UPI002FD3D411